MHKSILGPVLALAVGLPVVALAGVQVGSEPAGIVINPVEGAEQPLKLEFRPGKAEFKVGEPISFQMRGDRDYFVWLYAIDDKGVATQLIPGPAQRDNKYPANQSFTVPTAGSRGVQSFSSDRPGTERFKLVASTKHVEPDIRRIGKSATGFATMSESDLDSAFSAKGIVIRPRPGQENRSAVVVDLSVPIRGEAAAVAPDGAFPFVSLDRRNYRDGDKLRGVYGASEAGYVHLYFVDADGSTQFVKSEKVEAGKTYAFSGTATAPHGLQRFVAYYSDRENPPADAAVMSAKGFVPDPGTSGQAAAEVEFRVDKP